MQKASTYQSLSPFTEFFVVGRPSGPDRRRFDMIRYRTFEIGVLRPVDDTHPAFTKLLGDLVVADGAAGHSSPILPLRRKLA